MITKKKLATSSPFSAACTAAMLISLVLLASCGKVKNSNSADVALYGLSNQGGQNFKLAFTVIAQSCLSCHSAWTNWNETDFSSNGLIVSGSLVNSKIYYRIKNNETGVSGDMPANSNTLTGDELTLIKNWVLNFGQ